MSSIGPQLPPYLQKRKRTPDDDNAPNSPPRKTMRGANNEEITLEDDSSDDGYGPSTGPATKTAPQHSGPPPSSKQTTSSPKAPIGPSLPTGSAPKQPPIGPTPPPAPLDTVPPTNASDPSDSDSEDDYGPSLPTSASHASRLASSSLPTPSFSSGSGPRQPPPKRDDWMLAPPSAPSNYRERDPTKLKARKFATGRAATGNEAHAGGVSAIWTETPEEKARRLRDAVLGRGSAGGVDEAAATTAQKVMAVGAKGRVDSGRRTTADEDKIRSFTEQTRGRSLYDEHQMRKNKAKEGGGGRGGEGGKEEEEEEEEDDPSKRAFSWEKDMKSGGTISHTQRRQLLAKSADFGGRFDKGRYL
ncbi:hypothetical protein NKR19_g2245 [Coniochaeta hoffmannii]|uniref:DUF3752 domain-containing protein n=1 Tax=Coniochaeta hoffmannii TaxID=91930 RepID=A0AA38SJ06_9PEZI|nr:hypothetical protein NKR19_g2245 [Coniochaeta hoffmannii]